MSGLTLSWAAARVNASLTQDQVCQILNISKPTLINWEHERTEPSFSQAKTLATLYGISLDLISIKNNTNSKGKTGYRIKKPVS